MRVISTIAYSALLLTSALIPHIASANAEAPTALIEKALGGPIAEAKPAALEKALTTCVQQDPKDADKLIAAILQSGRADVKTLAPSLVTDAIKALGKGLTEGQLMSLIYAAVQACPDAVLDIVAAASHDVPKDLVQVIVSAAIRGIPDPYKTVEYRTSPNQPGVVETLSEAIIDTAAAGGGISDRAELVAAVNGSLQGSVQSPSALGVAGDSNYGNEPGKVPTPTPKPPVIPVVSK